MTELHIVLYSHNIYWNAYIYIKSVTTVLSAVLAATVVAEVLDRPLQRIRFECWRRKYLSLIISIGFYISFYIQFSSSPTTTSDNKQMCVLCMWNEPYILTYIFIGLIAWLDWFSFLFFFLSLFLSFFVSISVSLPFYIYSRCCFFFPHSCPFYLFEGRQWNKTHKKTTTFKWINKCASIDVIQSDIAIEKKHTVRIGIDVI